MLQNNPHATENGLKFVDKCAIATFAAYPEDKGREVVVIVGVDAVSGEYNVVRFEKRRRRQRRGIRGLVETLLCSNYNVVENCNV